MRRFSNGYWTVARIFGGVPLRLHWTLAAPVVALPLLGGCGGLALCACLLLLVVTHEWGHLAAVRAFGADVVSIDLWALGGVCRYAGALSPLERSLVALAGPGLNLALAAAGLAVVAVGPRLGGAYVLASAGAALNLGMGLFNLVPLSPMDGREALALPARWSRERAAKRAYREARLAELGWPSGDEGDEGEEGEDEARRRNLLN